jgi:serine phosphatase RsbU (regulator of sigma subunit)/PAS domain-containing protein
VSERPRRAVLLSVAAMLVLVAADVAAGQLVVPPVVFVLAPLAVALTGAWRETAATAVIAVAFASATVLVGGWSAGGAALGIVGCAVGGALAVTLARLWTEAEARSELARELAQTQRQFTSALDALGEAVTITDDRGTVLYVNGAGVELLRCESEAELLGAPPGEIMSRFAVYDENGQPVELADLPGARLLTGETSVAPMLVRNIVRATGEERWLLNKASLMPSGVEFPARVVNVIEDLTQLKRTELRQRLLAEATRVLSASLDYETTLQRVAEVVVPAVADWCSVALPGAGGAVDVVAVAHVEPSKVAEARALDARHPSRMDDATSLAAVLRGDSGTVTVEVPADTIVAHGADDEHLRLLREIGAGSLLVVPLDAGGRRLGAMVLVRSDPLRRFGEADIELAEHLGRRSAKALLNAQLYRERAELAATLQRGMLPPELPALDDWTAAALYQPAGEIAEVGGDFFDAFRAGEDWMAAIGDVTGHGPEAATLTTQARYTLRTAGQLTGDPVAAVSQLNRTLREHGEFSLCTAAVVRLSSTAAGAVATVASAGHPLPLLVREGAVRPVGVTGPLAGAFDDDSGAWRAEQVTVQPGDVLLLYTDGVVDALGHRGGGGDERLAELLVDGPQTAEAIVARLDAALGAEPDEHRRDDTAALALQLLPAAVPLA